MTTGNWLVKPRLHQCNMLRWCKRGIKRLPERGDVVIVAGSNGVKDMSVKAKYC